MDIFKKFLPDKRTPCILCDGKGEISPPKDRVEIRFGAEPAKLTPEELAVVMANVPRLWELPSKFGIDPTKVKVTFEFEDTKHVMPLRLAKSTDQEKN